MAVDWRGRAVKIHVSGDFWETSNEVVAFCSVTDGVVWYPNVSEVLAVYKVSEVASICG